MSKYENFSKEELLRFIEKQEQELAQKKYGLVWDAEREPEQVVLDCENNLPVLKRVKGKAVKEPKNNGAEDNILIEGDNYHALTVLNYTHKEKIDVIYIDPPYNTGNKDFKYNDRYVDREDGFRHSKWLNFMEKRLSLAKELLKETGIIFISIDDNEVAQLKLLCDKIFGEEDFIANLIWRKKKAYGRGHRYFIPQTEYVLVYKKEVDPQPFGIEITSPKIIARYKFKDETGIYERLPLWHKSPKGGYERKTLQYKLTLDGKVIDSVTGQFLRKKERIEEEFRHGLIDIVEVNGKYRVYSKSYLEFDLDGNERVTKPVSYYDGATTSDATSDLLNIFHNRIFDFSKPVKLIKFLIENTRNKNAIVIDFMAGSGTTGHAVLELNKEDGGSRKFILCTNNELNGAEKELRAKGLNEKEIQEQGICRRVCYPRIEKVIKGYKKNGNGEKVEGLGGNLQYFRTAMVKKSNNKDQVRLNLTRECTEMLCVKENIFNLEMEKEDFKIYSSNKKDKYLCVYYNILDNSFSEFIKEIKKLKGDKIVYMFSADDTIDKNLFKGIKDLTVEAIPQRILDVCKQLVKMNIPVKKELIFLEINKAKVKIFEEKEKNEGARILRIVLEKTIQKIAQNSGLNIYSAKGKEEKISNLNDLLKKEKIITQVEWEESKTYLTIGNYASHGDYGEYNLEQVQNFYKHIQNLLNKFNI